MGIPLSNEACKTRVHSAGLLSMTPEKLPQSHLPGEATWGK